MLKHLYHWDCAVPETSSISFEKYISLFELKILS